MMNFIRRLFEKLAGRKDGASAPPDVFGADVSLYDPNNKLYEVDLFDADGFNFRSIVISATDDIEAQNDAVLIYSGYGARYAIAELLD